MRKRKIILSGISALMPEKYKYGKRSSALLYGNSCNGCNLSCRMRKSSQWRHGQRSKNATELYSGALDLRLSSLVQICQATVMDLALSLIYEKLVPPKNMRDRFSYMSPNLRGSPLLTLYKLARPRNSITLGATRLRTLSTPLLHICD